MEDEKRMIETYEVKQVIHLAGGEVVLAEDASAVEPFLVCDCSWDNPFGVDVYTNVMVGADYLEVTKEFLERVARRVDQIEQERSLHGVSSVPLTADDCISGSRGWNYKNQLIVIKPEQLTPAARTADHQLLLATGGNGCDAGALGTAVFCKNLFTGEEARWERYHVAGIIRPDRMPEWASEKLSALKKTEEKEPAHPGGTLPPQRKKTTEKPSLLGKLEAAKKMPNKAVHHPKKLNTGSRSDNLAPFPMRKEEHHG